MINNLTLTDIIDREEHLLSSLNIERRIGRLLEHNLGVRAFAESFYFVRFNFPKLNFIVGARCPPHEKFWSGLALNLLEELGGGAGASHNQMYRNFLLAVGGRPEEELLREIPAFGLEFHERWESYCNEAEWLEALAAIAVYEALDQPDYRLLLRILSEQGIPDSDLTFFKAHAYSQHFELFDDINQELCSAPGSLERASRFVFETQEFMWASLMGSLESTVLVAPAFE